MNTYLETEAHRLYNKGIVTIGINKKVSVESWGGKELSLQTDRPRWSEVRQSIRHPKVTGIAIVLGPVSGNLYCRDWDEVGARERWASKYPEIAAVLPTVRTPSGCYHDYFISDKVLPTNTYKDGELRGVGAYVAAPPSPGYTWINPLNKKNLLTLDPIASGLKKENTAPFLLPHQVSQSLSDLSDLSVLSVNQLIELVVPTEPRQNHKLLFLLARGVLTLEKTEKRTISSVELNQIFRQWHARAEPFLRADQTFDDYQLEFLEALQRVKYLIGESAVTEAWARANRTPLPKIASCFETPGIRLLVGLCRELQRMVGDQPFWLACRTVAQLFEHNNPTTAAKWLRGLTSVRIIDVVERGNAQTNRASRYRYIQPLDD